MIVLTRALMSLFGISGLIGTVFFLSSFGPTLWTYFVIAPLLILLASVPLEWKQLRRGRIVNASLLVLLALVVAINIVAELYLGYPPVYGILALTLLCLYYVFVF